MYTFTGAGCSTGRVEMPVLLGEITHNLVAPALLPTHGDRATSWYPAFIALAIASRSPFHAPLSLCVENTKAVLLNSMASRGKCKVDWSALTQKR